VKVWFFTFIQFEGETQVTTSQGLQTMDDPERHLRLTARASEGC
jgi:hypothetical protein